MRFGRFTVTLGLLVSMAAGQVNLGTLARRPGIRTIWSRDAGRLKTRDAQAVFTALILEGSTQPPKRARGVRIDLSWADKKGAIFVDESLLRPQKKIFDQLALDIGRANLPSVGLAFIGSCEFRDHPDTYPLMADFNYSGPESPALRIFGPTGEQIMFPGLVPADLANVLGRAIDELEAH